MPKRASRTSEEIASEKPPQRGRARVTDPTPQPPTASPAQSALAKLPGVRAMLQKVVQDPVEPQKRKRRTRAEIEAEKRSGVVAPLPETPPTDAPPGPSEAIQDAVRETMGTTSASELTFGAGKSVGFVREFGIDLAEPIRAIWRKGKPDPEPPLIVEITPDDARALLARNISNRPMAYTLVLEYARQMQEGLWRWDNYEALKLTKEGYLLNGQHRLNAVIIYGKPVMMWLKFGVPREAQHTIDTGRKRTISDQLAIVGEKNARHTAAAVRWVMAISNETVNYTLATPETLKFLELHPELRESVGLLVMRKPYKVPIPLIAAIHFIASKFLGQKERADAFAQVLYEGVPDFGGRFNPAFQMREDYIRHANDAEARSRSAQMAMAIWVWNAFQAKRPIKRWSPPITAAITGYDPSVIGIDLYQKPSLRTVQLEGAGEILERVEEENEDEGADPDADEGI